MVQFHLIRKLATVLSVFVGVGAFDYLTGYEISSYPIYLMPILLTVFYFGKIPGFIACVVATLMWLIIDIADGHPFSHELVRYWAAASRLLIYCMFVYGFSLYSKTVAVHRRRLEEMRSLIPLCHGCGRIFWNDGTWKTPSEALLFMRRAELECPNCVAQETASGAEPPAAG